LQRLIILIVELILEKLLNSTASDTFLFFTIACGCDKLFTQDDRNSSNIWQKKQIHFT